MCTIPLRTSTRKELKNRRKEKYTLQQTSESTNIWAFNAHTWFQSPSCMQLCLLLRRLLLLVRSLCWTTIAKSSALSRYPGLHHEEVNQICTPIQYCCIKREHKALYSRTIIQAKVDNPIGELSINSISKAQIYLHTTLRRFTYVYLTLSNSVQHTQFYSHKNQVGQLVSAVTNA